jgi:hypothetical protein
MKPTYSITSLLIILLLNSHITKAQSTPIDAVAAGPHIFFEVRNIHTSNLTHTITFDLYMSVSITYANYISAHGASYGLENADVAYDIDLGTDGTNGIAYNNLNGPDALNDGTTATVTSLNNSMLNAANGNGNLPSISNAPYDDRFKLNLFRSLGSTPLTVVPTNVASITLTLPSNVTIGTVPNGAAIRLRYAASGYTTNAHGSKWADFFGNGANPVGNSWPTIAEPLPVKLIYFTAAAISGSVKLSWQAEDEKPGDHFLIERSANSNSFQTIATIDASNIIGTGKYVSYDKNPDSKNNFYRLKIVDADGKVQYSGIRKVNISASENDAIHLLSTIITNNILLSVRNANKQNIEYDLSDSYGSQIIKNTFLTNAGYEIYTISIPPTVQKGFYYLRVKSLTTEKTFKMLRQ